jgi:hypothetical protein
MRKVYRRLIDMGYSPEQAREALAAKFKIPVAEIAIFCRLVEACRKKERSLQTARDA